MSRSSGNRIFQFPTTTTPTTTPPPPPPAINSNAFAPGPGKPTPDVLVRPDAATVSAAFRFGPLTPEEIAQAAATFCKHDDPNTRPVYDYPGFIRRPDGLLQWDGKTIPPGFEHIFRSMQKGENAQTECARIVAGEGATKTTMEECMAKAREVEWEMDALKNRPFCPGVDLTPVLGPTIQKRLSDPNLNRPKIKKDYSLAVDINLPEWYTQSMPFKMASMTMGQAMAITLQEAIKSAMMPTAIRTPAELQAQNALSQQSHAAGRQETEMMKQGMKEREQDFMRRRIARRISEGESPSEFVSDQPSAETIAAAQRFAAKRAQNQQRRAAETASYFGGRTRNRRIEF